LTRTQTKDGSWTVPIRAQKNTGKAISHFGSGWAAIGLLHTLPPAIHGPIKEVSASSATER
jgi:hypothetical protein